ncbi:hypothetical protein [Streptomyces sp. NPDC091209]|uniref:hypothetical protein n=1 Tax=Streptomyces sp. NPDC091209 TaxID=3365974 RepID=UPI0037F3B767
MRFSPARHPVLRAAAVGAAALVVLLSSGCAAEQAKPRPKQRISVTLVNRYTDLSRMEEDSTAVVLADAVGSSTAVRDRFPITVTDLRVSKILAGKISGSAIKVQQLGTQDIESPDTSRLMQTGRTYLIYLSKNDGKENPDHFVLTGGDGLYVLQGRRYLYRGGPPAGPGKQLPAELAAASVEGK